MTLLKARGRTSGRVLQDPTGGVISGPQTHLPIPPTESLLISNSFGRAVGHPVSASPSSLLGAGLPEEEVHTDSGGTLKGGLRCPRENGAMLFAKWFAVGSRARRRSKLPMPQIVDFTIELAAMRASGS